jgi:hypothetical protein
MSGGSGWLVLAALAPNGALLAWLGKRANAVVEGLSAATASAGVELLSNVIKEIEREPFAEPALAVLARRFQGAGDVPASRCIARLARVSDWATPATTCCCVSPSCRSS